MRTLELVTVVPLESDADDRIDIDIIMVVPFPTNWRHQRHVLITAAADHGC